MYGEADLAFGPMRLWVLCRQWPEAGDAGDADWLVAHARAEAPGAVVEVEGPWLRGADLASFLDQLAALRAGDRDAAELDSTDPGLRLVVTRAGRGFDLTVDITPEHLTQRHRFEREGDASDLPRIAGAVRRLLERFPVGGDRGA